MIYSWRVITKVTNELLHTPRVKRTGVLFTSLMIEIKLALATGEGLNQYGLSYAQLVALCEAHNGN